VPARLNCWPAEDLWFARRIERLIEPARDRRMKSKGLHECEKAERFNLGRSTGKKRSATL